MAQAPDPAESIPMKNVIWLDVETTGLDENHHSLMSVAALRFDENWSNRREFHAVVHHPDPNALLWSPVALDMHRKSGLFDKVKKLSGDGKPPVMPLPEIDAHLTMWGLSTQRMILAGNSIHFDRRFITKHLPNFEQVLHYRMIDVSGICEAFRVFAGIQIPRLEFSHEALGDAENSIKLMQSCVKHFKS
jgi:oligoribonuclease